MISKISIQNFKSLKNIELGCGSLNLLTGINGMGKSSIIQAILLLRQSFDKGYLKTGGFLTLKGDLVNIGTGKDALYQYAEKEEITLAVSFKENAEIKNYGWVFQYEADSDVLPLANDSPSPGNLENLEIFNSKFKYLHAERLVQNQYARSDYQVIQNRNLGKHGEYTAHYLAHFGPKKSEEIHDTLLYPNTTIRSLEYQVSAWMSEVSPGTKVIAVKIPGVDGIRLSYEFTMNTETTNEFTPMNVGFGITYVLPVIVALLSAKKGDVLFIENPESHLHPQGQSAIAKLITLVAHQGIQIFIESHSDHIINGILVAVNDSNKNNNNSITAEDIKIYFINKDKDKNFASLFPIDVQPDGRIKNVPPAFFDQFSKDMKAIMGF